MQQIDKFQGYFQHYIGLAKHMDMGTALLESAKELENVIEPMSEDTLNYAYEEGKWTIKELLLHIADCERVFQYRALSFSRGDTQDLLGFEHDAWVPASNANSRKKEDLLEELRNIRKSSIDLFSSMTDAQLDLEGSANGNAMSARAVAFIVAGHSIHHIGVMRERYLKE